MILFIKMVMKSFVLLRTFQYSHSNFTEIIDLLRALQYFDENIRENICFAKGIPIVSQSDRKWVWRLLKQFLLDFCIKANGRS